MGSYNYLGFSENKGSCAEASIESIRKYGCGVAGSRHDIGKVMLYSKTTPFSEIYPTRVEHVIQKLEVKIYFI